jgi:hypothetical protein
VIRQEYESFTIPIQSAYRIHLRDGNKVFQGRPIALAIAELAQNIVGLVEQQILVRTGGGRFSPWVAARSFAVRGFFHQDVKLTGSSIYVTVLCNIFKNVEKLYCPK